MTIDWVCKHHTDLGKEQLYAILQLRTEVFVVEQKCAYQEVDGLDLDGDTCHLMAWDNDRLVAYLRLLDPTSQGGDVVIGVPGQYFSACTRACSIRVWPRP